MKTIKNILCLLVMLLSTILVACGGGGSNSSSTAFNVFEAMDDEEFINYCKTQGFDSNNDNILTLEEAAVVTTIDFYVASINTITSLAGIEYFTGLTVLECSYNQLVTLDVSANTKLTHLYCESNRLTILDLSANEELFNLSCSANQLKTLDISDCTKLGHLLCEVNQLTTLDVSANKELVNLYCGGNPLTVLDISNCTWLTNLVCGTPGKSLEITVWVAFDTVTPTNTLSSYSGDGTVTFKKL